MLQWLSQHGASFLVVFFITWWIVFYTMLPVWVPNTPRQHPTPGQAKSAPARPHLWKKFFITTGLTTLLSGPLFWICENWLFVP